MSEYTEWGTKVPEMLSTKPTALRLITTRTRRRNANGSAAVRATFFRTLEPNPCWNIYIYVLPQPRLAGLETNAPKTEAGFEPSIDVY